MQRRLAAILAADVASYSLLMNADEDTTYGVWKSVRTDIVDPLIETHNGRIVKHTGDGFLAEFPTGLAAVECGTTIQEEMANRSDTDVAGHPFQFRVGVNLGDIIVDNEDIHGDGVNIAARLESIAEPGGVCISGDVYHQVRNKPGFVFNDLGDRQVKNIRAPVRAYSVVKGEAIEGAQLEPTVEASQPTARSTSLGILFNPANSRAHRNAAVVVGRDKERAVLGEAWNDTLEGRGNIVLIRGEPGIGKSTLARQLIDEVAETSALVLFGQCHETLGSPPYWPWLQILKALEMDERYATESIAQLLESLDPSDAPAQSQLRSSFTANSGSDQFMLFNEISETLANAAQQHPLVLYIDDLHWADRSSLALFSHFGTRVSGLPVLIVGTYRDMEVSRKHPLTEAMAELNREATLRRIALKGLERDAVSDVMTRAVGQVVPETIIGALYDKTGGNPLFVSEVARMLRSEDVDFSGKQPLQFEMPEGIQDAAGQRFNKLSEECVKLLTIAAVVGRRFSLHVLSRVQPSLDELDMLELLEEAVEHAVIQEFREQGADFQFQHVLFRDILYEELSLARKAVLHGKVADVLAEMYSENDAASLGEIARHYYSALRGGNTDRVLEYADKAATQAAKMTAYAEAIEYQQIILDVYELDENEHRRKIAKTYSRICDYLFRSGGRIGESRPHMVAAVQHARSNEQHHIMAHVACLWAYWGRWQHESVEVIDLLDEVLELLDDGEDTIRANVLAHKSLALVFTHRRDEAESIVFEAINLAAGSDNTQVHSNSLCLGIAVLRGLPDRLDDRIELAEKAIEIARANDDLQIQADALEWLILSEQESGDITRMRSAVADLERITSKLKRHKGRYSALNSRVWLAIFEGRWDAAESTAEKAVHDGAGKLDSSAEGVYGAQMYLINRELGRLPMIAAAIRNMVDATASLWQPALLATYVEAHMHDEAHALLTQLAADDFMDLRGDELHLTCVVYFAQACVDLNRAEYAELLSDQLKPFSGQFVSHPTAVSYGPADLYLGMLNQLRGEADEAIAYFESAASACERAGPSMWLAHVAYRHAQALVANGSSPDDSKLNTLVDLSRREATERGMKNILQRLTKLEQAPDTVAQTDLSPKELQVLKLIATGKSNKDIATELSRSLPTVASHVRAILSKTNSANRTEAAAFARERNLV